MHARELHGDAVAFSEAIRLHAHHAAFSADQNVSSGNGNYEFDAYDHSRREFQIGIQEGASGAHVAQVRGYLKAVRCLAGNLGLYR